MTASCRGQRKLYRFLVGSQTQISRDAACLRTMFLCLPLKSRQASIPTSSDDSESGEKPAPSYRSALSGLGAGSAAVLSRLRALLSENKLDAYVIPNEDEHGSEIPAASELRRGFMTGFHGTAGLAVVTQTEALLFVDSRYWIAAEKAMDPSLWKLRKVDPRAMVEGGFQDYLCNLPAGSRIGVDARLIPPALKVSLDAGLPAGSKLVCQLDNLVDEVWENKPMRSTDPVNVHPLKFTGRAADSKLAELRETIVAFSSSASYLVTPLDDLAWLLNLRGNDMFNQPFFYAYLFVSSTDAVLFIDPRKVTSEVEEYLTSLGVRTKPYSTVWDFLKAETQRDPKSKVLVDPKASYAVINVLSSKATIIASPINAAKAIKNSVEIQGFYNANLRDSVAMVRWYGWLEEQVVKKKKAVTEYQAQTKLNKYRSMEKYWGGPCNFISAYGPSAALPHYEAEEEDSLVIGRDAPYLIDSGQQYLDATIDTTRTVHFGTPTKEHKRAFTRVLQAHIAIDALIFPAGTTGTNLDGIVRHHLWKDGMNFGHGPGHGIGSYGVVHESSTGISVPFVLKPGHVVTNEPGFYDEGKFGCRIESTIVAVKKKTLREFGGDIWMGFDRFTMIPIQSKLVDFSLLTKEETAWLDAHNKLSYEKLRPLLKKVGDKRALALLGKFF
ncbi:putative aminopeptidase P, cytoplasmic [Mycena albidolilacea]|uniref:Aminopeptidase P, cytoplasmic n=1 Tax=Mycena albidolilacea TaxID=1033008 RepID=A0AAD7F7F1_9AGAR|nr:putative aminopeptidase P, cytoplasmic [Mycena albidolilacea]